MKKQHDYQIGDVYDYEGKKYTVKEVTDTRIIMTFGWFHAYTDVLTLVSKANKMKEIVGYKLKEEFKSKESAIVKAFESEGKFIDFEGYNFATDSDFSRTAKELGVLDLWFDLVYKEDRITVSVSNNRTVIINKHDSTVTIGGVGSRDFNTIEQLAHLINQSFSGNTIVETIRIGCQTFTRQDVINVYNTIKELNK